MVDTLSRPATATSSPPPGRGRAKVIAAVIGLVVLALLAAGGLIVVHELGSRPLPKFPLLAAHPDASLQGTVAYIARPSGPAGAGQAGCVRVVAASGQSSKEVLCLPAGDVSKAVQLGTKETTPQLVWLPDGRLEVTVFRFDPKSGAYSTGWQKIVDVRAGQVVDTPAADVPSSPNFTTRRTVSPSGQMITTTSSESSGRVKVMLTDANSTRTLLSARGPGEYTYRMRAAFWAPDWQWIAADDGRLLVITPGNPSLTRILVSDEGENAMMMGTDPDLASFAVTATNIL